MKKARLKRILRETLKGIAPDTGEAPYIEQAQLEDVLLNCFIEWLQDGDAAYRADYKFNDFVNDVSEQMGLEGDDALAAAIEDMLSR